MEPREDISEAARRRLEGLQRPPPIPSAAVGAAPPVISQAVPPPIPSYAQRPAVTPTKLAGPLITAPKAEALLLPEELNQFKNLLVFARSTVEGYFSGKHKSPFR